MIVTYFGICHFIISFEYCCDYCCVWNQDLVAYLNVIEIVLRHFCAYSFFIFNTVVVNCCLIDYSNGISLYENKFRKGGSGSSGIPVLSGEQN